MNPTEVLEVLEANHAVLKGHFRLSSGRHSDVFVQKFRALEHPRLTERFGASIADLFDRDFDVVASPAVGALVLGFATALAADARMVFAERSTGSLEFRRGFEIGPHERVLVVEDVITTAGSAREVVDLVGSAGGTVVGVGALIDRDDPARVEGLGVPLRSLVQLQIDSWPEDDCPLCKAAQPLDDPGSRRLKG